MKLEMLISKLKATKATIDETVNDEESRNIERLKEFKTRIQNQAERLRMASRLSKLTKEKTRNTSQLMQLQSGLFEQAKDLSSSTNFVEEFQQTTPYIKEELYEYTDEELKKIMRPLTYESTNKMVHECGLVFKQLEFMCEDSNLYLKQNFRTMETTDLKNGVTE
jgi:uncharacterized Zn finger protein